MQSMLDLFQKFSQYIFVMVVKFSDDNLMTKLTAPTNVFITQKWLPQQKFLGEFHSYFVEIFLNFFQNTVEKIGPVKISSDDWANGPVIIFVPRTKSKNRKFVVYSNVYFPGVRRKKTKSLEKRIRKKHQHQKPLERLFMRRT